MYDQLQEVKAENKALKDNAKELNDNIKIINEEVKKLNNDILDRIKTLINLILIMTCYKEFTGV